MIDSFVSLAENGCPDALKYSTKLVNKLNVGFTFTYIWSLVINTIREDLLAVF